MTRGVVALVVLSAFIHAVWSFSIKGSRDPLAFNVAQTIPLGAAFLIVLPFADPSGWPPSLFALLVATGIAHAVYFYGLSLAFEGGDLSLVYPIARSTPAFLPLIAVPLAGERLSLAGALGIATVVAGLWAVQLGAGADGDAASPSWRRRLGAPHLRYAWLALLGSVGYGLFDKALMTGLVAHARPGGPPPVVIGFFAMWAACAVFFVPMALRRMAPGALRAVIRREGRGIGWAALIGVVGYGLILRAYETAPASYVVAVRQSSVLFVLVLSVVFLRERPGPLRVAGAVATVAGVALIAAAG